MANDLVRQGSLLGGTKNIVGNKYADLVLETLGKVYIKTGNSSRVLNDIFKLLDKINNEEDPKSKTLIVESLDDIDYPGDGTLIFDVKKKALYIAYDQRYVLILDSLEFVDDTKGYVKRSGDTMTGTLTIKTQGAPLIVASKELVKNLNAEYLGGYSASRFAVKTLNEKIYGQWSFQKETTFNGVTKFNNKAIHNDNLVMNNADIVTTGSVGSPEFASGFQGYGWRFDAATQMLTVDYLVVRKAMQVFELIVNQVKATNGSLWVTDSCEVEEVFEVHYLNVLTDLNNITTNRWYVPYNGSAGNTFIEGGNVKSQYLFGENISGPGIGDIGSNKTFYNFNYLIKFNSIPTGLTSTAFDDLSSFEGDSDYEIVHLFNENNTSTSTLSQTQLEGNAMYNLSTTPKFYSTNKQKEFDKSDIRVIYSYYKYFGIEAQSEINTSNISKKIKIVKMKEDTYPTFAEGDLVRCQKFQDNNIKYYDALVGTNFNTYYYVMLVADSVFDKSTTIKYSETGELKEMTETYNSHQYDKTSQRDKEDILNYETTDDNFYQSFEESTKDPIKVQDEPSVALATITAKDGLVRIGNLYKKDRQNSVFITSSEEYSPYVQTMNGVDRPDYSVVYTAPRFKTRRKIVDGVITEMYYYLSNTAPVEGEMYDEEWIIDNSVTSPTDEQKYLTTESTNEVIFMQYDGDYNDAIQLENIYRKQYCKYYKEPSIDCDIEKNVVTGKYKSTYTNHVRARFGRLDGIHHELFGDKQPYGYGLYGDNVFLTGEFFLSNGQAVADIGEDIKLEINNDFGKAGLYIKSEDGKPYIVLSADQIKILTENGKQSALFVNGRIEASLIRVSDLEAADTYVYYVDAITYNSETKEPIKNEAGEIEIVSTSYSFKPGQETVQIAINNNGHSAMNWTVNGEGTYTTYSVRTDASQEIITDVDTSQPYVRIDSTTGILEANSANLTGGMLTLYNQNKTVKVELNANDAHAGMTVSRLEGSDYTIVATYNGDVYNDPSIFYKSDTITIEYDKKTATSWQFGLTKNGLHEPYKVCYNKMFNSSYIPDWVDDYGNVFGDGVPTNYYRTFTYTISKPFTLTKPCDVRIQGNIELNNHWLQYKLHSECNQFVRLVYKEVGKSYFQYFGNVYKSMTSYFNNWGSQVNSGNTNTGFNAVQQLKPGTYELYLQVQYSLSLDNAWYEENPEYYLGMEIPTYQGLEGLYGPNFQAVCNIDNLTVLSNKFETKYFGNGFTSGFNQQNYFTVYNNQNSTNPAMIMDFQSNGSGMQFKEGKSYYYARLGTESAKLAMPIPIYSAFIAPSTWREWEGGSCLNYSYKFSNHLIEDGYEWGTAPTVAGYSYWKANLKGYAMYPKGLGSDYEEEWDRADVIIDFRNCPLYQGINLSEDNIIIQLTGHPYYAKDCKWARNLYACVYSRDERVIRVKVQDDSSGNDGAFFVTIYYLPAKTSTYSET